MPFFKFNHENLELPHENCEAPRAYFIPFDDESDSCLPREKSPRFKSLCGEWNFKWFPSVADFKNAFSSDDFYKNGFYEKIDVPSVWQLPWKENGQRDVPLYSNSKYPFPFDPPFVPDENPCGLYAREFILTDDYAKKDVYINFEGVDSAFYVWLNGEYIGYSQVSHQTSEFCLKNARSGSNRIHVLVVKWSDGSYLEDQDMFRFSGIFREVYLLAREHAHISDLHIKPVVAISLDSVDVTLDFTFKKGQSENFPSVSFRLEDASGKTVQSGSVTAAGKCSHSFSLSNPVLWNDEAPYLYNLYIRAGSEAVCFKVGFRRFEIEDSKVLLNRVPVKAKGINRHESHPVTGHTVSLEHMKNDLLIMKKCNVNCIRTSHYPDDPRFYTLCDELGFMVVDEADIETHGAGEEYNGTWDWPRWSSLSDSKDWETAYVDRAARLFERDKNHPCVVLWSLGNESGAGENHRAMAKYIRSRDDDALIHYENTHKEFFDPSFPDVSDVESRMYPTTAYTKEYLADDTAKKPFFLCEYVDSITTGDIFTHWDLVVSSDKCFGACIWEFCDHAVEISLENGKKAYRYGGDFGDYPNDGICCIDGLVYPDRSARPGLWDMKQAYKPFDAQYNGNGTVSIKNLNYYTSLSDYMLCWRLEQNGLILYSGCIQKLDTQARCTNDYTLFDPSRIPDSGVVVLTLELKCNKDLPYAEAGHEAGFAQFTLAQNEIRTSVPSVPLTVCETEDVMTISCGETVYTFDLLRASLTKLCQNGSELLAAPIKFQTWKAPAFNASHYGLQCEKSGLRYLLQKAHGCAVTKKSADLVEITADLRLGGAFVPPAVTAKAVYRFFAGGALEISLSGTVRESAPSLPRLGIELLLREGMENAEYFGYGPFETTADRCRGAKLGLFKTSVTDNFEHYICPMSAGGHFGTHFASVASDFGAKLNFNSSAAFVFCASHYMTDDVYSAKHDDELVAIKETVVNIDWKQNSYSRDETAGGVHMLNDKSFDFSFTITPEQR